MDTKISKGELDFPLWLQLQISKIPISRSALMKKSGLSRTTLFLWESKKTVPKTDHLIPFCQELSRLQNRRVDTLLREAIIAIKNSLQNES